MDGIGVGHDTELASATLEITSMLDRGRLHDALRFLNERTRHRFTGVYRFDPPLLRSLCLFDRENPAVTLGGDTPMRESYCSIVGSGAAPFGTAHAGRDGRLAGHPARGVVLAYCGVPLVLPDGSCAGSLCHFDPRPRLVPRREVPLLECAAGLIAAALASRLSGAGAA